MNPPLNHLISRTALDGYPIGDAEKEFFIDVLRRFGRIYLVDIQGFCCMGNHFHLLVRVRPDSGCSDAEVKRRFHLQYGEDQLFGEGQIPFYRQKWSSPSEFTREIKLNFTRFYNRRHGRRGYFWGDRFKSLLFPAGSCCLALLLLSQPRSGR